MTSQEVRLHGHRITFRTAGSGPVLLLIHGITGSAATWDDVMPWLAERFCVVAPDLLGHGTSGAQNGRDALARKYWNGPSGTTVRSCSSWSWVLSGFRISGGAPASRRWNVVLTVLVIAYMAVLADEAIGVYREVKREMDTLGMGIEF
jgi:pimeloyl-ACP methyl ester carboxylesterase